MVVISKIFCVPWDSIESIFVCKVLMMCMTLILMRITFTLEHMTLTILRPLLSGLKKRTLGSNFPLPLKKTQAAGKNGVRYCLHSLISLIEKKLKLSERVSKSKLGDYNWEKEVLPSEHNTQYIPIEC